MPVLQRSAGLAAALLFIASGSPAVALDDDALPVRIVQADELPPNRCELDTPDKQRPPACQAADLEIRTLIDDAVKDRDVNAFIDERVGRGDGLMDRFGAARYILQNTPSADARSQALQHYIARVRLVIALMSEGRKAIGGETVRRQSDRAYQVEIAWAEPYERPGAAPAPRVPVWASARHPARPKTAVDDHRCGGVLVNASWVLTAQHCLVDEGAMISASDLVVHAGATRLTGPDGVAPDLQMTTYRIDKVVLAPGYIPSDASRPPRNDLALLHLGTSVPDDEPLRFRAADYVMREPVVAGQVTAAGWGSTAVTTTLRVRQQTAAGGHDPMSSNLQRVRLSIVPKEQCLQQIRTALAAQNVGPGGLAQTTLPDDVFCAADESRNARDAPQATCFGDSGGPLMARGDDYPLGSRFFERTVWLQERGRPVKASVDGEILVGIVGWSVGCGGAPGVYTRVADHLDWIRSTIRGGGARPGLTR